MLCENRKSWLKGDGLSRKQVNLIEDSGKTGQRDYKYQQEI